MLNLRLTLLDLATRHQFTPDTYDTLAKFAFKRSVSSTFFLEGSLLPGMQFGDMRWDGVQPIHAGCKVWRIQDQSGWEGYPSRAAWTKTQGIVRRQM